MFFSLKTNGQVQITKQNDSALHIFTENIVNNSLPGNKD